MTLMIIMAVITLITVMTLMKIKMKVGDDDGYLVMKVIIS